MVVEGRVSQMGRWHLATLRLLGLAHVCELYQVPRPILQVEGGILLALLVDRYFLLLEYLPNCGIHRYSPAHATQDESSLGAQFAGIMGRPMSWNEDSADCLSYRPSEVEDGWHGDLCGGDLFFEN